MINAKASVVCSQTRTPACHVTPMRTLAWEVASHRLFREGHRSARPTATRQFPGRLQRRTIGHLVATLAVLMVAAGSSFAQTPPPKDPPVFKIGAIMPMTGAGAYYGGLNSKGIQLAADEINAAGGINGIPVEIVLDDNKSGNAEASVAAMKRMISVHGVKAVLTSYSPSTLAIVPIAEQDDVLLVNAGGTSQQLAEASSLLINDKSLAADLGGAIAKEATARGFRRMAILYTKSDAGENIVNRIVQPWQRAGLEVTAREAMQPGATNIDTQVAKLKASRPDFVALFVFGEEPGIALKRLRQFGVEVPVIGLEYGPDAQRIGGADMEGYLYINDFFAPTVDNPWSMSFVRSFKERAKEAPNSYAANYYESVYIIAEAARRARSKGGDYWAGRRLRAAISEAPNFPSVYGGDLVFQANGVSVKRAGLFRVVKGEGKFVRMIDLSH